MTPRIRKSVVILCIGLVLFAAFTPATAYDFCAILVPIQPLFAGGPVIAVHREAPRCDEQTLALLALLPSRAPPALA